MLDTSKKLPWVGSRTFSQEGFVGRTGPSIGADSRLWFITAWMLDKSPVYQTWEDRDRLVFQIAFPLHSPSHALAGLSFLHAFSLSRLEVYGMLLDLLDDGFLLNPSLEPPESALYGFSLVNNDKSQ
jgi:hypothetical protein